jgi:hypothetical protein
MELDCLDRQDFNRSKQLIHAPEINGDEINELRAPAQ